MIRQLEDFTKQGNFVPLLHGTADDPSPPYCARYGGEGNFRPDCFARAGS